MKWQSEEHVGLQEAAEWARHFGTLERDMDQLLADLFGIEGETLEKWITPGRYISGREFAEAGLAELVMLAAPSPQRVIDRRPTAKAYVEEEKNNGHERPAEQFNLGTVHGT